MNFHQIIILIGIIFLALVGAMLISSNTQERREKSILEEKNRLEERREKSILEEKNRLEEIVRESVRIQQRIEAQDTASKLKSCLADATATRNKTKLSGGLSAQCWGIDSAERDICLKNKGQGREICQLDLMGWVQQGICIDFTTIAFKEADAKFEKDEQNCYARHK